MRTTFDFVLESNKIEGITRIPTEVEVLELDRFISLDVITIPELERFVEVYQPGAKLRDKEGMNVRVGNRVPEPGGSFVKICLNVILNGISTKRFTPYEIHHTYETLHPFTDCNGRSGRALWLWHMKGDAPLGFLHTFYIQSLSEGR